MITNHTVTTLKEFEEDIARQFNEGKIEAPIHLAGNNESQLLEIFKEIKEEDWCLCQWRSHYVCLLKGVPPTELKAAIMAGRSISLCFPKHRIFSSAIAGGHLPIALGIAMGIKREGGANKVWVFLGDMTAEMGIFHECEKYARLRQLPIEFVIENNGKSVMTDTMDAWGIDPENPAPIGMYISYDYELLWPHSGAGKRVNF